MLNVGEASAVLLDEAMELYAVVNELTKINRRFRETGTEDRRVGFVLDPDSDKTNSCDFTVSQVNSDRMAFVLLDEANEHFSEFIKEIGFCPESVSSDPMANILQLNDENYDIFKNLYDAHKSLLMIIEFINNPMASMPYITISDSATPGLRFTPGYTFKIDLKGLRQLAESASLSLESYIQEFISETKMFINAK